MVEIEVCLVLPAPIKALVAGVPPLLGYSWAMVDCHLQTCPGKGSGSTVHLCYWLQELQKSCGFPGALHSLTVLSESSISVDFGVLWVMISATWMTSSTFPTTTSMLLKNTDSSPSSMTWMNQ